MPLRPINLLDVKRICRTKYFINSRQKKWSKCLTFFQWNPSMDQYKSLEELEAHSMKNLFMPTGRIICVQKDFPEHNHMILEGELFIPEMSRWTRDGPVIMSGGHLTYPGRISLIKDYTPEDTDKYPFFPSMNNFALAKELEDWLNE